MSTRDDNQNNPSTTSPTSLGVSPITIPSLLDREHDDQLSRLQDIESDDELDPNEHARLISEREKQYNDTFRHNNINNNADPNKKKKFRFTCNIFKMLESSFWEDKRSFQSTLCQYIVVMTSDCIALSLVMTLSICINYHISVSKELQANPSKTVFSVLVIYMIGTYFGSLFFGCIMSSWEIAEFESSFVTSICARMVDFAICYVAFSIYYFWGFSFKNLFFFALGLVGVSLVWVLLASLLTSSWLFVRLNTNMWFTSVGSIILSTLAFTTTGSNGRPVYLIIAWTGHTFDNITQPAPFIAIGFITLCLAMCVLCIVFFFEPCTKRSADFDSPKPLLQDDEPSYPYPTPRQRMPVGKALFDLVLGTLIAIIAFSFTSPNIGRSIGYRFFVLFMMTLFCIFFGWLLSYLLSIVNDKILRCFDDFMMSSKEESESDLSYYIALMSLLDGVNVLFVRIFGLAWSVSFISLLGLLFVVIFPGGSVYVILIMPLLVIGLMPFVGVKANAIEFVNRQSYGNIVEEYQRIQDPR